MSETHLERVIETDGELPPEAFVLKWLKTEQQVWGGESQNGVSGGLSSGAGATSGRRTPSAPEIRHAQGLTLLMQRFQSTGSLTSTDSRPFTKSESMSSAMKESCSCKSNIANDEHQVVFVYGT